MKIIGWRKNLHCRLLLLQSSIRVSMYSSRTWWLLYLSWWTLWQICCLLLRRSMQHLLSTSHLKFNLHLLESQLIHISTCCLVKVLRCLSSALLSCFVVSFGLWCESSIKVLNEWSCILTWWVIMDYIIISISTSINTCALSCLWPISSGNSFFTATRPLLCLRRKNLLRMWCSWILLLQINNGIPWNRFIHQAILVVCIYCCITTSNGTLAIIIIVWFWFIINSKVWFHCKRLTH